MHADHQLTNSAATTSQPWPADRRWTECLGAPAPPLVGPITIGVLPGEGIGPEVISCALDVFNAVAHTTGLAHDIRFGGPIGTDAERATGTPLPESIVRFCRDTFACGGAVLNGPGGGRYVYELRCEFDLFLKISPLRIVDGLPDATVFHREAVSGVDILITRENSGGVYQGTWSDDGPPADRTARHHFSYTQEQVTRFLCASARLAHLRRGLLTVVWKESGVPAISRLWRDCAEHAAAEYGVRLDMVDIDLMAYRLVQQARSFDVIAAPNLFGDVLADLGAALLGSRGLSYSGNYDGNGRAVYQTNHGSAHDLVGTDRANPAGQLFSLAMMLRESFNLPIHASLIEEAVRSVWREGWRTQDVAAPATRIVGTREMGHRIAERASELATVSSRGWRAA